MDPRDDIRLLKYYHLLHNLRQKYLANENRERHILERCLYYDIQTCSNKKLSYRRGTARCVVSVEILSRPNYHATVQKYLYDKS